MVDKSQFGLRLKAAFGNATNAIIGSKIGVAEGTVGFYVRGRIPDAEVLVRIRNAADCNIDWLLTGEGEMRNEERRVDFTEALRDMIRELIKEELDAARPPKKDLVLPIDLSQGKKTRKAG